MQIKEDIAIINKIEREFDVGQLQLNGLQVWPVVRTYLHLRKLVKDKNSTSQKSLFKQIIKLTRAFGDYYFKDRSYSILRPKKSDLLLVADVLHKVRDPLEGKWMNKFLDPLISKLDEKQSHLFMEISFSNSIQTPRYSPSYFLNFSYLKFLIKEKIQGIKIEESSEIIGFKDLMSFCKQNGFDLDISEKIISYRAQKVLRFKRFFLPILKKIEPKIVLFPVYYSNLNMGLILACRELGIRTVEIQHGQQGQYHMAYSHWENYPKSKYDLHPDAFWMWSKENVKRITSWADGSNIEIFSGGNPWINYYRNKVFKKRNKSVQFPSEWKTYSQKVLVSTQFIDDFLEGLVPKLMMENQPEILWLIRLHPNQVDKMEMVRAKLDSLGCQHYNLEWASKLPLYDLFEIANYNVTYWSTVAYEAHIFGLTNIIVHPHGKAAMSSYIEQGTFAYAENADQLKSALREFVPVEPGSPYIDYDDETISKALERIFIESE